ncbi:MAG: TolC family protein [Bacteroidales bacterium]|nr:TolC family protein [Bacteroidales bacterium]
MRRLILTWFLLLTGLTTIVAQTMNLTQCIVYALEHNLSYTNKNIEATISNEQYLQARRDFLPFISAGSSGVKSYGRSIDPTTNTFITQDFLALNFNLDLQLELFRGFSRLNAIRFQKLQYQISNEELKQKEMEIAFMVMNSYYDALYFRNLEEIMQEQVRLTALNVEKTRKMIDLGLKAESDILEITAQEASELHQLILAQNQYEMAMLTLKNLMYFPADTQLYIESELMPASGDALINPDSVYRIAFQHMPGVRIAEFRTEASKKNLAMTRAGMIPRLTTGSGIYTNFADSRMAQVFPNDPDNNELNTVPFADQWEQNMSQSLYLSLQVPIFSKWSQMSQVKNARLEQQMAINARHEEQLKLYQLINEDIQQLQSLRNERNLLKAKKDAIQEAYTIAEKKLDKGLISIIELYMAKNQLSQAEADWMRIRLQLRVKETTIRFYLGEKIY